MKKILLINAWARFDEALEYIEQGGDQYPLDHFWAYDALKKSEEYEVSLLHYDEKSFLNKLGLLFRIENLQQQIDCIKKRKEYDAIYDPFMEQSFFLAFLKTFKLFNKPMFSLAQRALVVKKGNPLKTLREYLTRYFYLKGTDYVLYMNQSLFVESNKYPIRGNTDYAKHWGVDFNFFESYCSAQTEEPTLDYVLSTGGTARDFNTLIHAFSEIETKLKIIPKKNMGYPEGCPIIPNVIIDNSLPIGLKSTGALRKEYYNALAVAIPLQKKRWFAPFGNTILLEALAMGKPVITTINKAYPIDVEKEKVGYNIDYGDVKAWKEAILYLENHPDEAREMGERGRCLCKKRFNYELFSQEVMEQFGKAIFKDSKHKELKMKAIH